MDKNFFRTLKLLAIVAVVYTLLVLIIPFTKNGVFWLSFVYTLVALFGQAYIQQLAYRRRKPQFSKYYHRPIAQIGVYYLLAQFVLGLLLMILANVVPLWLTLVLYILLLAAAVVGIIAEPVRREAENSEDD